MIGATIGSTAIFRLQSRDLADMIMKKHDADESGGLDKEEGPGVPILSKRNFRAADSSGDGEISKKELVSYIDRMKQDFARGSSGRATASLLAQSPVTDATFARIDAQARNNSGKLAFMRYINDMTSKYDDAARAAKLGEPEKAQKLGLDKLI